MSAQPAALPDSLPAVDAPSRERTEIHCEDCAHKVNARRAAVCVARGHRVSVVQITVTTFNSVRALPFAAAPAPYLGSSR